MKRYEWEDALIEAQARGEVSNGDLMVAIKLAKAINWNPSGGRKPGLYWKNEEALRAVGCGRATYFKHRKSLVETGFFAQEGGNLIPTMPKVSSRDSQESTDETGKSTVETNQSLVETPKSLGDNPFTVDSFTVEVFSEDTLSVGAIESSSDSEVIGTLEKSLVETPAPSNSKVDLMPSVSPSSNKEQDRECLPPSLIFEMKADIIELAKRWEETPEDDYWIRVFEIASDPNFQRDLFNAGQRIGQAQSKVAAERRVTA